MAWSVALLARAARQRGLRWLASQQGAAAEVTPALASLSEQQQQQRQLACFGSLAAARHPGWAPLPLASAGQQQLLLPLHHHQQQPQWQQAQQQRRGYAIGKGRYQPRRRDVMPDRNLPERNEQIRAPEASLSVFITALCSF